MAIEVSVMDLYSSQAALGKLGSLKAPVELGYKLARIQRKVTPELEEIDKVRVSLVEKFGEDDGKGTQRVAPGTPEYREFAQEFEEFLRKAEQIEINVHPIRLSEMVKLGDQLTVGEISLLSWMIEDDLEE